MNTRPSLCESGVQRPVSPRHLTGRSRRLGWSAVRVNTTCTAEPSLLAIRRNRATSRLHTPARGHSTGCRLVRFYHECGRSH